MTRLINLSDKGLATGGHRGDFASFIQPQGEGVKGAVVLGLAEFAGRHPVFDKIP